MRPGARLSSHWLLPAAHWLLLLECGYLAAQPAAIDPREGLPVVSWQDARQVTRQRAVVYGTVVDVGGTETIQFLNFSKSDRSAFKIVIFAHSLGNFPSSLQETYLRRPIAVEGFVTLYDGDPQIVVSHSDQIQIVASLPESWLPERRATARLADRVTLATYNVRNLFDSHDDPYANDESTAEKPRGELDALAATIHQLNADVLALQEVENKGMLQRFVDVFLADMDYRHVALVEGNDMRGIDVAVVSRVPLGRVTTWAGLRFAGEDAGTDRFQRDLLCVEVRPENGDSFEVYVVHLKSKGGSEASEAIRQTEARQIRQLLDQRMAADPDVAFAICGDFNDEFESPSLQTIVGSGPGQLIAHFDNLPEEQRITFNREPYRSMIDFVLCSPAMARRYIPQSYRILPGTLESSGSDHNPVLCQFHWRDPEPAAGGDDARTVPVAATDDSHSTAPSWMPLICAFLLGGGVGGWWGFRQARGSG